MSFYVPLPTRTADQKIQYADFKMISDAIEMMLQQIQFEGEQGMQDFSGAEEIAPLPEEHYQNPYYQPNEDNSRWTNLKTNSNGMT